MIWKETTITPCYIINNNGEVKNKKTKQTIKPHIDKDGYLRVVLYCGLDKPKNCPVHRLVALAFIPNPNSLPCVNHKDENSLNNNINNLEWCTVAYNNEYGTRNERAKKTIRNKMGKMVKAKKDEKEYFFSSIREAAKELNIYSCNISSCLSGRLKTTGGFEFEEVV